MVISELLKMFVWMMCPHIRNPLPEFIAVGQEQAL
jgi:hypothetical protein